MSAHGPDKRREIWAYVIGYGLAGAFYFRKA